MAVTQPNMAVTQPNVVVTQPNLVVNQPNMAVNCGLSNSYPTPCMRRIWGYGNANHEAINIAINNFDSEKSFSNANFVPNKLITVGNSKRPWVDSENEEITEIQK